VGPALAPGLLLNLDLVATPDPPVPNGVWGLGPELPRGLPYQVPLAWLGNLLDGALVAKGAMVLVLVVAFAGAHRLAAGAHPVARLASGLVYAAGPFLATRLAIGHLGTAAATAVLPWALPTLLRPGASLRRTLLWSAALGACGVNGGILAGFAILVGLVADRGRRAPGVLGVAAIGQLPWLVPGLVVATQGVDPAGAAAFSTRLDGPLGLVRVAAGQGYFIADFDVGGGRLVIPLAGAALLAVALLGRRRLPEAWGGRAGALAVVGFLVAVSSGLPGIDRAYEWVADSAVGLPLREGQRVLPLFLVWLAPAAALGWERLRPRFAAAPFAAVGVGLVLVGPSLWGFGGQLDPVPTPPDWADARRVVESDPGPLLALPFTQYVRPNLLDGHLVHQPLPFLFGGDVLYGSGRGVEDSPDERADERLDLATGLVADLRAGEDVSEDLARLGLRWIAVLDSADPTYDDLDRDPGNGLERVVAGSSLTLYRVTAWPGAAVDGEGHPVAVDTVIGPWARVEGDDAVTWFRPGAGGWLRGTSGATVTADGNLAVPGSGGPIWYWPSLLVLAADGLAAGAILVAWRWHR
jgi:hypothetical protein